MTLYYVPTLPCEREVLNFRIKSNFAALADTTCSEDRENFGERALDARRTAVLTFNVQPSGAILISFRKPQRIGNVQLSSPLSFV